MTKKKGRLKIYILTIFVLIGLSIMLLLFTKKNNYKDLHIEKPNIIFITIDTLRADHMGTYGYKYETTPNIDRFSKDAVVFEYATTPMPKTSAAFASIMTGLHPFVHKTRPIRSVLRKKWQTIAESLKISNYNTHAIVDNSNLSPKFHFNKGFDSFTCVWDKINDQLESTDYITTEMIKFLNQNRKEPFFLWAHYIEPHAPYLPPEQFIKNSYPKGRNIKKIVKKIIIGTSVEKKKIKTTHPFEGHYLSLYDASIRYNDNEIGKIIDLFYKKKLNKNTILIIASDHGEELGEHNLFFDHGYLTFPSSIRVPLIIYLPGKEGYREKKPVSLMDIFPTILNYVKVKQPYEIQGKNLFSEHSKNREFYIYGSQSLSVLLSNGNIYTEIREPFSKKLNVPRKYFYNIFSEALEKENLWTRNKVLAKSMKRRYEKYHVFNPYPPHHKKKEKKPKLSKKELKKLKTLGYIE